MLVWNSLEGFLGWMRPSRLEEARTRCPTECLLTYDKAQLDTADGVIFHGPNHDAKDFPPDKPPDQRLIFLSLEQPQ